MPADVSLVLNVHRESQYLARTFRSLLEAMQFATAHGLVVDICVVADNPNEATRETLRNWVGIAGHWAKLIDVSHSSLALARRAGVEATTGNLVSLHDADDLISYNYLTEKYAAVTGSDKAIAICEHLLLFGIEDSWTHYTEADPRLMIEVHPYISQILAPRLLFSQVTYRHPRIDRERAYEDWHFNCEALAAGYKFVIAKDTFLFYRQHRQSIMGSLRSSGKIFVPEPSRLFNPEVYVSICEVRSKRVASASDHTAWASAPCLRYIEAAAAIEPQIAPLEAAQRKVYENAAHSSFVGDLYFALANRLKGVMADCRHIFLLPSLDVGGGEKYMLQILEAISLGSKSKILVITTDWHAKNAWAGLLPSGVLWVDIGSLCREYDLHAPDKIALGRCILRLCENSGAPLYFHVKPSALGHDLVSFLAPKLPELRIVYYRWCDERRFLFYGDVKSPFGQRFLDENFARIHTVLCDSEAIKKEDESYFGMGLPNWHVVRAHVGEFPENSERSAFSRKLIWASRMHPQKRFGVVPPLMRLLKSHLPDVHVDIYAAGASRADVLSRLPSSGNYTVMPAFLNIDSVGIGGYDALIYTSYYDGIPNIILEAMVRGVPVVAVPIGGMPEVLSSDSGYIVADSQSDQALAMAYLDAIKIMYADEEGWRKRCQYGRRWIESRHGKCLHRELVHKIFDLKDGTDRSVN